MNLIPIKKETRIKDDKEVEVFVVPALSISNSDNKVRKVPHPEGNDVIVFHSLEKAQEAINVAGFSYSLYKGDIPENFSSGNNSDSINIIEPLLRLLDDKSPGVVSSAIFSLGEINCIEAIKPLINILGREDNVIRKNAIEALAKIGAPAVPYIIKSLDDTNWEIRNSAAICLGEMANYALLNLTGALNPLINRLNDSNSIVKSSAAISLGKIYKNIKRQNMKN